jgi:hypothetical protein
MSPTLAHLLMRLHAPSWRRRYGEEFQALLVDTPLTAANVLNACESATDSRRITMIIPLVALASLVIAALVIIPAHRSTSRNPIQVAAAKDPVYNQRSDHAVTLRGIAPCRSKRERDDKGHCA